MKHLPDQPKRQIDLPKLGARFMRVAALLGCGLLAVLPTAADTASLTYDANGNAAGQQAATAGAPVILSQPVSKTAPSEGGVSFSIDVSSSTPVTYQWQLNGVNIAGATGDSLYITNPTLAGEGTYTVVVTNSQNQSVTATAGTLTAPTHEVLAWGHNDSGETSVPGGMEHVVGIAAGERHGLALQADGTVVAWGDDSDGQTDIPSGLSGVVAIAAGGDQNMALLSSGTIVQWGDNDFGVGTPPAGLSNVVAIAAGTYYSLALQANGTVAAWGNGFSYAQTNVPVGLNDVTAIAAGAFHGLALKADGTVVAWGSDDDGQIDVPAGLSGVVAIGAGANHSLAVLSNGTVVAWGDNTYGQTTVPTGLTNVVAVTGGDFYSAALLANGTVVTWGDDGSGVATPPANLSNVLSIAGGGQFVLALLGTDPRILTPIIISPTALDAGLDAAFQYQVEEKNGATSFTASGLPPGLSINSTTGLITGTPNQAGTYSATITVTNSSGTSQSTIVFTVNTPVPLLTSAPTIVVYSNIPFSSLVTASNSPSSITATGLPAGLSLNSSGLLSGTATAAVGSYAVNVTFSNSVETNTVALTLEVQRLIGWGEDNTSEETTIPPGLGNLVAVAAGQIFTLGLNADGSVVGWGDNSYGETTIPAGLNSVAAIAAGADFGLALLTNGTVTGWGDNSLGQARPPAGLDNIVAIAAGNDFSVALRGDGTVVAWGDNSSNQTTPPNGLSNVVAISAGDEHALALLANGTVVGWGDNTFGEINIPAGLSNVVAIAAGSNYSLALLSNGTVTGWGAALGNSPIPTNLSGVIAISAGDSSLVLLSNGTVVSWGVAVLPAPTPPSGLSNVVGAFSGQGTSFALLAGQLPTSKPVVVNTPYMLAGVNSPFYGQIVAENSPTSFSATGLPSGLNINSSTGLITGTPATAGSYPFTVNATNGAGTTQTNLTLVVNAPLSLLTNAAGLGGSLGLGESFSYQLTASNSPTSFSATGLPPGVTMNSAGLISGTPSAVGSYSATITITNAYGAAQNTLTFNTQMVLAWGDDDSGETNVPANLNNVVAVSAGSYFSLALLNNGTVVGWGDNTYGETSIPPGLTNVAAIAAGGTFALALQTNGTVVSWGDNSFGETTIPAGVANVVAIAAGPSHSLALLANGTVVGWGEDVYNHGGGAIVKPSLVQKSLVSPSLISGGPGAIDIPSGLTNVIAIAAGGAGFSLALQSNGTVVGWGDDNYGEIDVPANLSDPIAISAGYGFSLALQADGTVVGWGDDSFGQIDIPAGLNNVVAISAGAYFAVALQADGTVVAWGQNFNNQTTVPSGLTNAVAISAGYDHALALLSSTGPLPNASLAGLALSDGTLVPAFSTVTTNYFVDVPDTTSSITLAPTTTNASASVTVNGQPVVSGAASNPITLATGPNSIAVVVTAPGGQMTQTYTLNVIRDDTVIATQQGSQTDAPGGSATFSVGVTGTGPFSYQWFYNGTAISGATNSSYTVSSLTQGNAGNYWVTVSNLYGATTSSTYALNVSQQVPALPRWGGIALAALLLTIGARFLPRKPAVAG